MTRTVLALQRMLAGLCVSVASMAVGSATIPISGALGVVVADTGTGLFAGTPLGTLFTGAIDDTTFSGQIGNGTAAVEFGCCIAAGGVEVFNDQVLDAGTAAALNLLAGKSMYAVGGMVDSINVEGDAATPGGGRIEVGVTYLFASDTFADNSLSHYPFDPGAVQMALFFVFEEDSVGDPLYDAVGVMPATPVPEPSAWAMLVAGLGVCAYRLRRRLGCPSAAREHPSPGMGRQPA